MMAQGASHRRGRWTIAAVFGRIAQRGGGRRYRKDRHGVRDSAGDSWCSCGTSYLGRGASRQMLDFRW